MNTALGEQSRVVSPRSGRLGDLHVIVHLRGELHVVLHLPRLSVGIVHDHGRLAAAQRLLHFVLAPGVRVRQPFPTENILAVPVYEVVVSAGHEAVLSSHLFGQG